jgi:acetolactate synthase-1/2/3 large subunit
VPPPAVPPELDGSSVDRAAAVLASAASPVVIAGGGVVLGGASAQLTRGAELLQAPVVSTREGQGAIDDRHALSVGTMWVNRRMRPVLDAADVVLAVGSRVQGFGLGPQQRLVQLDVDGDQIGRNHPVEVAVVSDAVTGLDALAARLEAAVGKRASRADEVRAMRSAADGELRTVGPQAMIVDALRAGVPDDGILVCDTTTVAYFCHMYYKVYEPRTYFSTSYMGTLGFAYPAALGVKVARPERPVVTVVGDGGFLFASNELATAVQHGIHTVTVVFDDGAYGNSNRDQREKYGGRELGTELRNPDWVKLAEAFGARGVKVDDIQRLPAVLKDACGARESTVIAVPMDRLPNVF